MITNVPGVVLCTFYADCVPLYFVDPSAKLWAVRSRMARDKAGKIKVMVGENGRAVWLRSGGDFYGNWSIRQIAMKCLEDVT